MSWIIGRKEDYVPTTEELYEDLIEKIREKIEELDEEFKSGELDFDGREKRYFAMMILKDLLK